MASQKRHGTEDVDELGDGDVNGSSSNKKQKKTRTRDGCMTCRKSKKACDKTHPHCVRCTRLNYECEWPEVKPYSRTLESSSRRATDSCSSSVPKESQVTAATETETEWTMNQQYDGNDTDATATSQPLAVEFPALDFSASATPVASSSLDYDEALQPVLLPSITDYSTASPPSNALDAQFWHDNSLAAFDFNASDIGTLLRLAGLPVSNSREAIQSNQISTNTTASSSYNRITLPKDKLELLTTFFPPRVVALLKKLVEEQEASSEIKLPLAYVVSVCIWCPSSAVESLIQAAKRAYSGPGMQAMLTDLGEVAWTFLSRMSKNPANHPKMVVSPESIASMPISFSSRLFALMDVAYREVCLLCLVQ